MFPNNQIREQYPPSNQHAHGVVHNVNTGLGFQQIPMYANYSPQGMNNFVGQQLGMTNNSFQQSYMPNHLLTRHPVTQQGNSPLNKHERYKLEQQRKFKNLGQSFKNTSIDSMLDDIVKVNPSIKTISPATPSDLAEDDFGDFLQATTPAPAGPSNSINTMSGIQPVSKNQNIIPQSLPTHADPIVAPKVPDSQKPTLFSGINLESKMMASLDLNAPQQATRKFKPSLVDITTKVEGKTFQASTKSANWSQLNVNDSEFHVPQSNTILQPTPETPPQTYPNWIHEPSMIPLLYTQVLEVCISADGMVDTAKVYPILLKSQLSNDILGKLWSLANVSVPGRLNPQELYILLALIALTQKGEQNLTTEAVLSYPNAPLPNLDSSLPNQTTAPIEEPSKLPEQDFQFSAFSQKNDIDDFDDFQDFQSVPQPTTAVSFSVAQPVVWEQSGSQTMSDVFVSQGDVSNCNPSSVVSNSVDTPMQSSLSLSQPNVGNPVIPKTMPPHIAEPFTDFVSSEFSSTQMNPMQSSAVVEISVPIIPTQPTVNKYSEFHSFESKMVTKERFQSEPQQIGFDDSTLKVSSSANNIPAIVMPSISTDKYSVFNAIRTDVLETENNMQQPNMDPPSYTSIFSAETQRMDKTEQTDPEFGEFEGSPEELKVNDGMNDTAKSWNSTDLFMNRNNVESLPPLPGRNELASFNTSRSTESSIKNSSKESDMLNMPTIKVDVEKSPYKEVKDFKLTDSPFKTDVLSVKSDTNSVKSLEFTGLSQTILQQSVGNANHNPDKGYESNVHPVETIHNSSNDYGFEIDNEYGGYGEQPPEVPDSYDEEFNDFEEGTSTLTTFDAFEYHNSQKQNGPENLELPALPSQVEEDPISPRWTERKTQFQKSPSMSPTPAENSDIELERRIIETLSSKDSAFNASGKEQPSQPNVYVDQWERCLSACYNVISNSNEILSAIQSPSVCAEVVSSSKGSKFITDLGEVYSVACNIFLSAQHWNLERDASKLLHKQIQLAWNNLLSFCPNAPVNELSEHGIDQTDACGVCLLAIKRDNISYGGSHYHATCANFWINCVASTLPSLHLPAVTT